MKGISEILSITIVVLISLTVFSGFYYWYDNVNEDSKVVSEDFTKEIQNQVISTTKKIIDDMYDVAKENSVRRYGELTMGITAEDGPVEIDCSDASFELYEGYGSNTEFICSSYDLTCNCEEERIDIIAFLEGPGGWITYMNGTNISKAGTELDISFVNFTSDEFDNVVLNNISVGYMDYFVEDGNSCNEPGILYIAGTGFKQGDDSSKANHMDIALNSEMQGEINFSLNNAGIYPPAIFDLTFIEKKFDPIFDEFSTEIGYGVSEDLGGYYLFGGAFVNSTNQSDYISPFLALRTSLFQDPLELPLITGEHEDGNSAVTGIQKIIRTDDYLDEDFPASVVVAVSGERIDPPYTINGTSGDCKPVNYPVQECELYSGIYNPALNVANDGTLCYQDLNETRNNATHACNTMGHSYMGGPPEGVEVGEYLGFITSFNGTLLISEPETSISETVLVDFNTSVLGCADHIDINSFANCGYDAAEVNTALGGNDCNFSFSTATNFVETEPEFPGIAGDTSYPVIFGMNDLKIGNRTFDSLVYFEYNRTDGLGLGLSCLPYGGGGSGEGPFVHDFGRWETGDYFDGDESFPNGSVISNIYCDEFGGCSDFTGDVAAYFLYRDENDFEFGRNALVYTKPGSDFFDIIGATYNTLSISDIMVHNGVMLTAGKVYDHDDAAWNATMILSSLQGAPIETVLNTQNYTDVKKIVKIRSCIKNNPYLEQGCGKTVKRDERANLILNIEDTKCDISDYSPETQFSAKLTVDNEQIYEIFKKEQSTVNIFQGVEL